MPAVHPPAPGRPVECCFVCHLLFLSSVYCVSVTGVGPWYSGGVGTGSGSTQPLPLKEVGCGGIKAGLEQRASCFQLFSSAERFVCLFVLCVCVFFFPF